MGVPNEGLGLTASFPMFGSLDWHLINFNRRPDASEGASFSSCEQLNIIITWLEQTNKYLLTYSVQSMEIGDFNDSYFLGFVFFFFLLYLHACNFAQMSALTEGWTEYISEVIDQLS